MLDQDVPPVEEGETGGGVAVAVAEFRVVVGPDAISSTVASTRPPWTTATARRWQAATITAVVPVGSGPALRQIIRKLIWSRFLRARTPTRVSSDSLMTYFSKPR